MSDNSRAYNSVWQLRVPALPHRPAADAGSGHQAWPAM